MELQHVEVLARAWPFRRGRSPWRMGQSWWWRLRQGSCSGWAPDGHPLPPSAGAQWSGRGSGRGVLCVQQRGYDTREVGPPAIQRVDGDTGQVDILYTACDGQALGAPNDLIFDETGRFWFTDYGGGAIYYASPDGNSITRAVARLASPNGIGLAPGGDVLYWAQTDTRQVHRRRLSGPGQLVASGGYDIGTLVLGGGLPTRGVSWSGCRVRRSSTLWRWIRAGPSAWEPWSKAVSPWCLRRMVPISATPCPNDWPTGRSRNLCFGGADLQTAYVTCSITGRLISCRWPRPGLRLAFQRLPGEGSARTSATR